MSIPTVIWGASGHAKVAADILSLIPEYRLAGFVDDVNAARHEESFFDSTVLAGNKDKLIENLWNQGVRHALIGIGDNKARLELAELLTAEGFQLIKAVHPSAIIGSDVTVGEGTLIAAGAVINAATKIGKCAIVNTCASVDHDCVISDGVHIGPGCRVAGGVTVGKYAWLGIGATVIDKRSIGEDSIVGAGAVVIRDVPDAMVVAGVPARTLRPTI